MSEKEVDQETVGVINEKNRQTKQYQPTVSRQKEVQVQTRQLKRRKVRKTKRRKNNYEYRQKRLRQELWDQHFDQRGLPIRKYLQLQSEKKLQLRSSSKSLSKIPKNIAITLNLVSGSKQKNYQSKIVDVHVIKPKPNLLLESRQQTPHQQSTKFPSINSTPRKTQGIAIQTQMVEDPKEKIVSQIRSKIQARKGIHYLESSKEKRKEESQRQNRTKQHIDRQNDRAFRKYVNHNVSKKAILLNQLQKAYKEIKFPYCHYQILRDIINLCKISDEISPNDQGNGNNAEKYIKQEIMKIRFMESDVIFLKQNMFERYEIIEDIRQLIYENSQHLKVDPISSARDKLKAQSTRKIVGKKNENQKIIVDLQSWSQNDLFDLKNYLKEYRQFTANVIKEVIMWKSTMEGLYLNAAGVKKNLQFTYEDKNILLQIGYDIDFAHLMTQYKYDPMALTWIKDEKLTDEEMRNARFFQLALLQQMLVQAEKQK